MTGRKPFEHGLRAADRRYLSEIVREGRLQHRVANRARVPLALDRGERIVEIVHWLGVGRRTIWRLWQHYQRLGVAAVFDAERSGRPPVFSPAGAGADRAPGLHRPGR